MDFSKLKKNKSKNLQSLTQKMEEMNGGYKQDERIYRPGFDKTKPASQAVVRFLPNCHDTDESQNPFVKRMRYGFKGSTGAWYIENSPFCTSFELKDPVAISNRQHKAKTEETGDETYKKIAEGRKMNTKYFANVFVVSDPVNTDAVGRVMIMEFGPQLFKIVENALKPEFEDEEPLDPFDLWDGADFKIKMVSKEITVNGNKMKVPNYEKSEFASPSAFLDGDETEIEKIWKQTHPLTDLIEHKTFDELAVRFKAVTGEDYDALEQGVSKNSSPVDEMMEQARENAEQSGGNDETGVNEEPKKNEDNSEEDLDDFLKQFQD